MTDYFLLNPYYKDFPQTQRPLLFSTVYGEQHIFFGITFFLLAVACVGILAMLSVFWREVNYLTDSAYTRGVVTETCLYARNSYFYSYKAETNDGSMKNYVGEDRLAKDELCPKAGASVNVEYLHSRPETGRIISSGSYILSNLCVASGMITFLIWITISFLREVGEFRRAGPRYERLKAVTTIVDGKIIMVRDSEKGGVKGGSRGYYIEVEYEFVFNTHHLRGTQIQQRDDLHNKPLPPAGTSVRVLFADADAYVML